MKKQLKLSGGIVGICTMLVLILDSKTAVNSAQNAINLCLNTVVPSLFPFFVLSNILNNYFLSKKINFPASIRRFCKIPKGSEFILLLGLTAGYPIGAKMVAQTYESGKLSEKSAKRMLGFCNNAGPAFIFGMLTPLFKNLYTVFALWFIHIISALLISVLLPNSTHEVCDTIADKVTSFPKALENAIKNIALVCGWVIVFRVIIGFCDRWFFWLLPVELQVLFAGLLELSNGCVVLGKLPNLGACFIFSGVILGFGGLCVGMQTSSVTHKLGTGYYFPGKVLQALFSFLLCCLLQPIFTTQDERLRVHPLYIISAVLLSFIILCCLRRKKL